ncbi:hypothetical protein H5410_051796 [Solanum commersonii]|uniref:Uncharacterized protein n=1 Tax=Solanum commersonii TaxID=4109 RepID=A0A9J5WZ35_SOLCO|nr:hypothetical protein H5410_051796 [Solanum commersonii]
MLMIPFFEIFEYILRYWTLDMAKTLENGCSVCVDMWDVYNDDFALWCIELFKDRGLGDNDEIGLYWDPIFFNLVFKLLSQTQEIIEIGPPLMFDPNTARHIKNYFTLEELAFEKMRIPFSATLNIIEKNDTKKYEDKNFTFRKLSYDDFFLSIVKLINNRGLEVCTHQKDLKPTIEEISTHLKESNPPLKMSTPTEEVSREKEEVSTDLKSTIEEVSGEKEEVCTNLKSTIEEFSTHLK